MPPLSTYKDSETFEVEGMTYTGPQMLYYKPVMANLDNNSLLTNSLDEPLSVDNFMVKRLDNGKFELLLTHSLKETNNHVDKFQVVASWNFESLAHLDQIVQNIVNSVTRYKNDQPL